jgi:ABC-type uncharacterized transport system fused permease/ATPase subunit
LRSFDLNSPRNFNSGWFVFIDCATFVITHESKSWTVINLIRRTVHSCAVIYVCSRQSLHKSVNERVPIRQPSWYHLCSLPLMLV